MRMRIKVEPNPSFNNLNNLKYGFKIMCYAKKLWTVLKSLPFVNSTTETKCFENLYVFNGRSHKLFLQGFYDKSEEETVMTT